MTESRTLRFVGGMRWGGFNASWPLAELLVTEEGVRVQLRPRCLRRLLAPLVPSAWMPWDAIAGVERVSGALMHSKGIRFIRSGEEQRRLVFWCTRTRQEQIMNALTLTTPPNESRG